MVNNEVLYALQDGLFGFSKKSFLRFCRHADIFVCFAQAWLDRSWLWHRSAECIQSRVRLMGDVDSLSKAQPTVVFAPHFVGLDVGWTALTLQLPLKFTTIFTPQSNRTVDAWVAQGRERFGIVHLFRREDGVKPIVSALRDNALLYLLPDMNFGANESIFVPFYGEMAATVPSLSRFAKFARIRHSLFFGAQNGTRPQDAHSPHNVVCIMIHACNRLSLFTFVHHHYPHAGTHIIRHIHLLKYKQN